MPKSELKPTLPVDIHSLQIQTIHTDADINPVNGERIPETEARLLVGNGIGQYEGEVLVQVGEINLETRKYTDYPLETTEPIRKRMQVDHAHVDPQAFENNRGVLIFHHKRGVWLPTAGAVYFNQLMRKR